MYQSHIKSKSQFLKIFAVVNSCFSAPISLISRHSNSLYWSLLEGTVVYNRNHWNSVRSFLLGKCPPWCEQSHMTWFSQCNKSRWNIYEQNYFANNLWTFHTRHRFLLCDVTETLKLYYCCIIYFILRALVTFHLVISSHHSAWASEL